MSIQVERAVLAIRHELGQLPSKGMTALEIVEMAYSEILAVREGWTWASRVAELDTVAASAIIRLPDDFGSMDRPSRDDVRIRILQDDEFYRFKDQGTFRCNTTFFARQAEDDDGWFLEFAEAFSASEVGQFRIFYMMGPVAVTDGEQTLPLPREMHKLLLALCKAIAKGYEESDSNSAEVLVQHVLDGPTYDNAVKADMRKRARPLRSSNSRLQSRSRWNFGEGIIPIVGTGGGNSWPS